MATCTPATLDRRIQVAALLRRAAALCRSGWCRGCSAQNETGARVTSVALAPANPSPSEVALSPVRFDVGSAMFRAIAVAKVPKGSRKEMSQLLYLSVPSTRRHLLDEAQAAFCRTAGAVHPSIWNDQTCKSGDQAADMLERAANEVMKNGRA